MKSFYVTFGQKYRHEVSHPAGGHPDGWFEIQAENQEAAREKIVALCGGQWAFIYDVQPKLGIYPKGCLKVVK